MVSADRPLNKWPRRAALNGWFCDSGAFTHVTKHGGWTRTYQEHAELVSTLAERVPGLEWAAPQDWMCEQVALQATGLSIKEHQELTIQNYLDLQAYAPEIPWIPVLQGFTLDEYLECYDLYILAGVDLPARPLVGLGSVCRRQNSLEIELVVYNMWLLKLKCHGFGVKLRGLDDYKQYLQTADSQAWSAVASYTHQPLCRPDAGHRTCSVCYEWAHQWYDKVYERMVL